MNILISNNQMESGVVGWNKVDECKGIFSQTSGRQITSHTSRNRVLTWDERYSQMGPGGPGRTVFSIVAIYALEILYLFL